MQHKTEEASYRNTFRALKKSFPSHHKIAEASVEYIASTIVSGGLSNQKAKAIRNLLDATIARFGKPSLEPLRATTDKDTEFFAFAARCRQENCAVRFDVLARSAGFPGGHALLAYRPAAGMGQANAKKTALRTARH